jgi:hypothetical protein
MCTHTAQPVKHVPHPEKKAAWSFLFFSFLFATNKQMTEHQSGLNN